VCAVFAENVDVTSLRQTCYFRDVKRDDVIHVCWQ